MLSFKELSVDPGRRLPFLVEQVFLPMGEVWSMSNADLLQSRNQKMLVPWKESYDQPRQHVKKQRPDNKGQLVKAMVFPVVTYRCESWTIKKAER